MLSSGTYSTTTTPERIMIEWRKSARSGDGGNCVEIAEIDQR